VFNLLIMFCYFTCSVDPSDDSRGVCNGVRYHPRVCLVFMIFPVKSADPVTIAGSCFPRYCGRFATCCRDSVCARVCALLLAGSPL